MCSLAIKFSFYSLIQLRVELINHTPGLETIVITLNFKSSKQKMFSLI